MTAHSNVRGILALLASAVFFVLNDSCMKIAMADVPPFQVLFMRGLAGCLWALPLLVYSGEYRSLPAARNKFVLGRGLLEVAAVLSFALALSKIPIGDVTAIFQITPLIIVLVAAYLFGEKVGTERLILVALGFGGALLVAQPGGDSASPYALLSFFTAFAAAIRDLVGRRIPKDIPVMVATVATMVLVLSAGFIAGQMFETWVMPASSHMILMVGAGLGMMLGHLFTILAFRLGDAHAVAPFYYSFMIAAVIAGYVIFGDVPNVLGLAGMTLILLSGLGVVYLERRAMPSEAI